MQTLESHNSRVLFLNKKESDTEFLVRDLPMQVIRTGCIDDACRELQDEHIKGFVVDVASAQPKDIVAFKKNTSRSDVPILILAHPDELPQAIEYIKLGAQGFLVKGLSDSDSVLKLMHYATSQH